MRVLLAGGGTLGPVTPLLAVAAVLHARGWEAEFVGTPTGPEGAVVTAAGFRFHGVPVAKLNRGWGAGALKLPAHAVAALRVATRLVRSRAASAVVGAGGFSQVPLAYAAATRRIPILIHQQDVVPSLSNRLVAPVAAAVTVALPESARFFPAGKVRVTGNPVRSEVLHGDRAAGRMRFGLDPHRPLLLVLGGGTGALALNRLTVAALGELLPVTQVLHLTGSQRGVPVTAQPGYAATARIDVGMGDALAAADAVVCRGGFSTLSEILQGDQPALVVPLPKSHQAANARYFGDRGVVQAVAQADLTPPSFVGFVRTLLAVDPGALRRARAPFRWSGAAAAVADAVERLRR